MVQLMMLIVLCIIFILLLKENHVVWLGNTVDKMIYRRANMVGTVGKIEDHGSVVIVWVESDERILPVYFDHRPFKNLWEAEDGDIVGREVEYDEENNSFEFLG